MNLDADKTAFRREVWERDGKWYAKVSSDFEDEGELDNGGQYYKRVQTSKVRVFHTEMKANEWAHRALATQQLAIGSGK